MSFQQLPLAITANHHRFENYYISSANQAVVSALREFIGSSGDTSFYLWGNEGSGVSHLLNACLAEIPVTSQFLPLSLLKDYPPEAITEGIEKFPFVCIDDVEAIQGNAQWEEALFHVYNRLRDAGSKLLIGSHSSPRNLPINLPDLKSRLQWGAVFHIDPLDDPEKQRALQFCAANSGLELSDDVAQYILSRSSRSTGDLFQLIETLDKASLAEQRRLTIPFVRQVMQGEESFSAI